MYRILIASKSCAMGLGQEGMAGLCRSLGLEPSFETLAQGMTHIEDFEAVVVGIDKFGEEYFSRGSNLRAVMKFGVGTDNIDAEAAQKHGVKVLSMPGVNSEAVAEMAFALMMAATRRVAEGDRLVRGGKWPRLMGNSPIGKTLGIAGTGSIGCTLARLVSGLDMKLIGYDVLTNDRFPELGGSYVEFDRLLAESDYISIHLPLVKDTRHLFDARAFSLMKPTAYLINTARGSIVDEKALYDALKDGKIAGAALDVFESEPPQDSLLMGLDNTICLSHISAYTSETMKRMDTLCAETLQRELA